MKERRKKGKRKEMEKMGVNLLMSYLTISEGVKRNRKIVECNPFLSGVQIYLESYFFISE